MRYLVLATLLGTAITIGGSRSSRGMTAIRGMPLRPEVPTDVLIAPLEFSGHSEEIRTPRAHPHPHGDRVCASGCALSRHPTELLSEERFDDLIRRIASDPERSAATDELLYFGPQAAVLLRRNATTSTALLTGEHRDLLLAELSRRKAHVALQLIAEDGRILAELPDEVVPLDLRHEFNLIEHGIPPLLASGTVKRVGRYRLWARL